jgi:hypothetical protein
VRKKEKRKKNISKKLSLEPEQNFHLLMAMALLVPERKTFLSLSNN